jgi:hypothetical protein
MSGCLPPDPLRAGDAALFGGLLGLDIGPAASATRHGSAPPRDSGRGEAIQHDEIAAHAAHREKDARGAHCEAAVRIPDGTVVYRTGFRVASFPEPLRHCDSGIGSAPFRIGFTRRASFCRGAKPLYAAIP